MDIMLDLERLRTANEGLKASVKTFNSAAESTDGLEASIGTPDDRDSLRNKAHDFEGDWNDRRDALSESLGKIQEQLQAIIDGWTEFDVDTANSMTSEVQPAPVQTVGNPGKAF